MARNNMFYRDAYTLAVDEQLDEIFTQVKDPFQLRSMSDYIVDQMDSAVTHVTCMDAVVAGISERLGLPSGLSFEEVFGRIG